MSENGIKTTNFTPTSTLDEVIGNKAGSTSRLATEQFATQLVGSGALAARFLQIEKQVQSGLVSKGTWAELVTLAPSVDGTGGEVLLGDKGNHLDATSTGYNGASVENAGRYSYNLSWARWQRIGDSRLSEVDNTADVDKPLSTAVEAALSRKEDADIMRDRKRRWEALYASLSAGKVPRGVLNLADYGIVDWPNVFDIKLYWTGSQVYPLKLVDADFHQGWRDGDIVHIEPNGDVYRSVSVALMHAPEFNRSLTLTEYHCDFETGVDTTASGQGLSIEKPYKTLKFAIDQAKLANLPFNIFVYADLIGISSLNDGNTMMIPDGLVGQITGVPKRLGQTWLAPMRDALKVADFQWTNPVGNVYRSVSTAMGGSAAVRTMKASVDALNLDDENLPTPLKHFGGVWSSEAEAQAAVAAHPGSAAWYQPSVGTSVLFVHMLDGRVPDPVDWWHYETTMKNTWSIGEGAKLFLKNIGRFAWDPGANLPSFRARPINVDPATRVEHTGQFWMYNCAFVGPSGEGIQLQDIYRGGWDYLVGSFSGKDPENIHSFYANKVGGGNYMHIWSGWTRFTNVGFTTFEGAVDVGTSNQISSCHDEIWMTRINQVGSNTKGACIADVLGAQTLTINGHYADPVHGDGQGSPNTAVWCSGVLAHAGGGALSKMRMLLGSSKVPIGAKAFSATLGGVIEHAHMNGPVTSEVTGVGSDVVDLLGG